MNVFFYLEDSDMKQKTAAQMRQERKERRAARKAGKVTVREVIEMLAKCDWDSEVTCINEIINDNHNLSKADTKKLSHKITKISQQSVIGTQIVFKDD